MSKDKVEIDNSQVKHDKKDVISKVVKTKGKETNRDSERKGIVHKNTTSEVKRSNESSALKKSSVSDSTFKGKVSQSKVQSKIYTKQVAMDTPSSSSRQESFRFLSKDNINTSRSSKSKISNANIDRNIINSSITRTDISTRKNSVMKTKSNEVSKPTKTSIKDETSNRVSKEKYFSRKYSKPNDTHKNEINKNGIEDKSKTVKKNIDGAKSTKSSISAKQDDVRPSLSRERTLTRILSPSEVKVIKKKLKDKEKNDLRSVERPRTSTIKKSNSNETSGSEMSTSTLTSNASTVKTKNVIQKSPSSSNEKFLDTIINAEPSTSCLEDDYEDDFDSYESDFEEDNSSSPADINTDTSSSETEDNIELKPKQSHSEDEERKMDSGTYDLPELKHKQVLDKIKEAIEKENHDLTYKIIKNDPNSNLASLSDEGFDEKFSLSNGFINFSTNKPQKKKIYKRRELMNMIRLDTVTYNLFEMKALSYDEYMKSFGRSDTIQISSQTGDDNLDEEIQTESIIYANKWTQNPIRIPKTIQNVSYNYFGVGEDPPQISNKDYNIDINEIEHSQKLEKFIKYSGNLISSLLENKNVEIFKQSYLKTNNIPFSEGFFKLNMETYPFLTGRSVVYIEYSKNLALLTVHKSNTEVYMNPNEQLLSRSVVCIWNLLQPMKPQEILTCSGEIKKACFDKKFGYLVFAGVNDGSVSAWDLREYSTFHRSVYVDQLDEYIIMRCPTYTTTATSDDKHISSEIIAIQAINGNSDENKFSNSEKEVISMQICTLTQMGKISMWSIIQRQNLTNVSTEDHGLVPWGSIVLVQGFTANMQDLNPELKELHCYDLQCSEIDSSHIYIATNYGVLHCLTSGMKPKPKIYIASIDASKSVSVLEMCPYSSVLFLAGTSEGCIRLHSRHYERALMNLRSVEENSKSAVPPTVDVIQWSRSRPCVFYVKDSNNYIHVWDLLSSDMYPIYSIPFREEVTCIRLSPGQKANQSYMAISTKKGNVYLHGINDQFGQTSAEKFTLELKTFLNYVNRL